MLLARTIIAARGPRIAPRSLFFPGGIYRLLDRSTGPELTNWPPGTHNGTEHEHHAAFLSTSGGVRSGFNPSLFSDASCGAIQI